MTALELDVLLVGQDFHKAGALADQLHHRGFRCHFASSSQAARQLLASQRVDLVLCEMHFSDGTGFGLAEAFAGLSITMFVCVPVEDSCYWLPAIDQGSDCRGSAALRPFEFTRNLEELAQRERVAPLTSRAIFQADRK